PSTAQAMGCTQNGNLRLDSDARRARSIFGCGRENCLTSKSAKRFFSAGQTCLKNSARTALTKELRMRSTAPRAKSGDATNAPRCESHCIGIVFSDRLSVNHTRTQWQKEAGRLLAEYRRTGDTAHLRAFRVHRAAMGARLQKM